MTNEHVLYMIDSLPLNDEQKERVKEIATDYATNLAEIDHEWRPIYAYETFNKFVDEFDDDIDFVSIMNEIARSIN